ncbi:MAG: tyrosine-type recombinase/integrase [Blastocatellia bacterium]|nr:tyrosine-type recombinase/integrase [Blastocatellia bacterium]
MPRGGGGLGPSLEAREPQPVSPPSITGGPRGGGGGGPGGGGGAGPPRPPDQTGPSRESYSDACGGRPRGGRGHAGGKPSAGRQPNGSHHALRHSKGYCLANGGCDTRLIQDYLGHVNISTVRYEDGRVPVWGLCK